MPRQQHGGDSQQARAYWGAMIDSFGFTYIDSSLNGPVHSGSDYLLSRQTLSCTGTSGGAIGCEGFVGLRDYYTKIIGTCTHPRVIFSCPVHDEGIRVL